jgi:hypothetical protein
MSSIGYYRYKLIPSQANETINLYDGATLIATANVKSKIAKGSCNSIGVLESMYIKFLDQYGRYRFHMFNELWKTRYNPRLIGSYNKNVLNIRDNQSDKRNIGYDTKKLMSLQSTLVSKAEKEVLSDIYLSPRVYLRVGGSTDKTEDWVLVTINGDSEIVDNEKAVSNISIELELPKHYTVTT